MLALMTAILFTVDVHGQITGEKPHTIEVIESSVRDLTDSMIARCDVSTGPVPIRVRQHPDAIWIRSILQRRMQERGITTLPADEQTASALDVVIEDASTRYDAAESRDSVERRVTVKLSTTCRNRAVVLPSVTHRITLARQQVESYQTQQHAATYGVVPPSESSIWDDVLEPLIYVAAAAVTVVLFFTVRTQ